MKAFFILLLFFKKGDNRKYFCEKIMLGLKTT